MKAKIIIDIDIDTLGTEVPSAHIDHAIQELLNEELWRGYASNFVMLNYEDEEGEGDVEVTLNHKNTEIRFENYVEPINISVYVKEKELKRLEWFVAKHNGKITDTTWGKDNYYVQIRMFNSDAAHAIETGKFLDDESKN